VVRQHLREDGHDVAQKAAHGEPPRNDARDVALLEHEPKAEGSDEDKLDGLSRPNTTLEPERRAS